MTAAGEFTNAVAIIGMAGRAPKASDLAQLWRNLVEGVEGITHFSAEDAITDGVDPELVAHPNYVKARGFLEDVALFDAPFFSINPREAEAMDPQQRLFLETAWSALEDAGYDPLACPGSVGVFAGCAQNTYFRNNLARNPEFIAATGAFQFGVLGYAGFLTTRVSYKLNLKGPSVQVDTACSTSLVAIVMACHSLLTYQCDAALAGGVMIGFPQRGGYLYQQGEISSPDGHCRPFDAKAQGTVGGEGVGVLVLKRLEDALAAGDPIRAVIRGAAINNDGAHKVGFTAPSVEGQAEVISSALALAGVEPDSISYVEAHGTATNLGDPIEVAALTRAWRARTARTGFCALGSIKSNIGHADFAAGALGLIKTVLALEHRTLPKSLHFELPNPEIDFARSPFRVQAVTAPWEAPRPLRAAVSSFGIGGTNAHLIVEEAPALPAPPPVRRPQLLVLSAKTKGALEAAKSNLAAHLTAQPGLSIADVAFTLAVGRTPLPFRAAAVIADHADAVAVLTGDTARLATGTAATTDAPVVFLFSGQGAQYPGMARELWQHEPVFRQHLDACAEGLRTTLGLDLREVLYPDRPAAEHAERLGQTWLTQPALFAVEYAMAQQWIAWGVKPTAVVGHSVGELVAACVAGVLELPDALTLVAARGRLMQDLPRGDMLSVPLAASEVQPLLGSELSLAAINSPGACVVSGPSAAVQQLETTLAARGVPGRRLQTSHAFHSAMMAPIVAPFTALAQRVKFAPARLPAVSTVTGQWIQASDWAQPEYWARNLREPVQFAAAAAQVLARPDLVLLEVGPGRTLCQLTKQQGAAAAGRTIVASLPHPQESGSAAEFVLAAAGRLWAAGVKLDWKALHADGPRRRVRLPTYAFDRQRFFVPCKPGADLRRRDPVTRLPDPQDWLYTPSWQRAWPTDVDAALRAPAGWLIVGTAQPFVTLVCQELERRGHAMVRVQFAGATVRRGPGLHEVVPGDDQGYAAALTELSGRSRGPVRVLHFGAVAAAPDSLTLDQARQYGWESVRALARVWARNASTPIELLVVSNRLLEVGGDAPVAPQRALVLGPCTVLPQELPHVKARHLDIVTSGDPAADAGLAARVAAEVTSGDEPVVALRGGQRWTRTFIRVPQRAIGTLRVRAGGTYLITGGLGGLGLLFAAQLARSAAVRLVLVQRTAFVAREQWPAWLRQHGAQDPTSVKIQKLQEFETQGSTVVVHAVDIAAPEAVAALVSRLRREYGQVDGVVHAAGIANARPLDLPPDAGSAAVLAPKVEGTLALAQALAGEPLEFFVLCSSLASVLGGLSAADYVAANAFLDAFARSRGRPFQAIAFDAWNDVGMVAGAASDAVRHGIRAADAPVLLPSVLGAATTELLVSTRDLDTRIQRGRQTEAAAPTNGEVPAATDLVRHTRPELVAEYLAPRDMVETAIAEVVQELLGLDRVGVRDSFFDLGFDSLLAHRMIGRLQELLGFSLPLRVVLERPSIEQISQFLQGANEPS